MCLTVRVLSAFEQVYIPENMALTKNMFLLLTYYKIPIVVVANAISLMKTTTMMTIMTIMTTTMMMMMMMQSTIAVINIYD